jgi:hypothetical protein
MQALSTAVNLEDYPPFEEEPEERTHVALARYGTKAIPFGSTLSVRPLRVRYDNAGKVVLTSGEGGTLTMDLLPLWERRELYRHLRFMSEVGAL